MGRTIKHKQVTSGWVDETLTQDALDLIHTLPGADTIESRLRRLLGRYRANIEMRNTAPQNAAAKNHMARLAKHAQAVIDCLDVLPARERALLQMHVFRATGAGFPFRQFGNDLILLSGVSERIAKDIPAKGAGEKPKILEKMLLSDTAALIEEYCPGTGITEAVNTARRILYDAGVRHHLPAKPVQAVAAWRKQAGD